MCNWGWTDEQSTEVYIQALVSADEILPSSRSKLLLLVINLTSVPGGQLVNSPTVQAPTAVRHYKTDIVTSSYIQKMTNHAIHISLSKASVIAGLTILIMALVAPYSELFIYPKLVNPINPAETIRNITSDKLLFITAIFCYLLTFMGDIVVSWALYILLKPVNQPLSLLTAWFRLVFSIIGIVALLNLVTVFQLLTNNDYIQMVGQVQLYGQVMLYLKTFKSGYHFGILFFSIHLVLIGYLVYKSGYIPKWLGVVLIISGLGYLTNSLKPFLFPDFNSGFITITFFGELIFMFWLLIKGSRIKDPN